MQSWLYVPSPDEPGSYIRCSFTQATTITGRSRRTIQRWARHRHVPDPVALALLQNALYGRLPAPWGGWRIVGQSLVSPDGQSFTTGDLRAAYVNAELVRGLRQRVQDLEQQLARARRTPLGRRIRAAAQAFTGHR